MAVARSPAAPTVPALDITILVIIISNEPPFDLKEMLFVKHSPKKCCYFLKGVRSQSLDSLVAMWRVGLLLYLVAGTRQLSITEFLVPNAVQPGEDVRLQCRYELSAHETDKALFVKWWWTPLNGTSDQRSQMYQRIEGHPAAAIHHDIRLEENDDILLLNVTPDDSGTYECEVSNIDEVRKHDQLIVFTKGSGPALNITVEDDGSDEEEEDDNVLVTCSAYGVAPYPDLVITINKKEIDAEEFVTPNDNIYDITNIAMFNKSELDGADISCELFYKDVNITHPQYIDSLTYHIHDSAPATTELAEDSTTEAPDTLQYTPDAGYGVKSCALLVIAAFLFTL